MADLVQTPLGWQTIAPDGSEVHLPEDVARDVFPDFFEDAPQPAVQLPLPEPEPAPVATPDPNQHRPPIADKLAQGQLPAGASGASYSYSGTRPQPRAKHGLIDVESAGQLGNQLSEQAIAGADQATDAQAAKYGAQLEYDREMIPFANEKLRMAHEFEAAEAERHNRAAEELAAHEQRIAEAIAAVPQENPGRYWQNLDGFTAGIATLTMMMGSLAGGGKSNQVADFAMQLVDRDMRAQEANIATAKAKVGFAEDAYARSSQQSYYDKLDLQEMKALKLETLASGMEQTAAGFKSKFTQAEFLEQAAKIRMERDKVLADIAQQRQAAMMDAMKTNLSLQEQRAARAQQAAQFREQMSVQRDKDKAEAKAKAAEGQAFLLDPQTGRPFMVNEKIAATIDKGEFGTVRKNFAKDASALSVAKQYAARMQEVGAINRIGGNNKLNPDSAEYQELNRLRESALYEIRHTTAGAALTEKEIKNWEFILSKPTTVLSQDAVDDVVGFVKTYGENVQREYGNTYGLSEMNPDGTAGAKIDLAKEWGSIDLESTKAPDAAELHVRMNETAKGIALEHPRSPNRGPVVSVPNEPTRAQAKAAGGIDNVYTGKPAAPPPDKRVTNDSVRRLVKDAETFKTYLDTAPIETKMTPDLVQARIDRMADEAMELYMAGYEEEQDRLLEIRKDLIKTYNTDFLNQARGRQFNKRVIEGGPGGPLVAP